MCSGPGEIDVRQGVRGEEAPYLISALTHMSKDRVLSKIHKNLDLSF